MITCIVLITIPMVMVLKLQQPEELAALQFKYKEQANSPVDSTQGLYGVALLLHTPRIDKKKKRKR